MIGRVRASDGRLRRRQPFREYKIKGGVWESAGIGGCGGPDEFRNGLRTRGRARERH